MKKLLILLLLTASSSTFAGSQLDFTLSDFCYHQPNVQDRGGVLYYPNEEVGITDSSLCVYKDLYGQYNSKVELVNGKFEGKFIRWWENGQKHQERYYKNGKLNGKDSAWWSDGRKIYEKNYKNGILNGLSTEWYENESQKSAEGEYIDGKANGKWAFWFPNGQIAQEYFKIDGKRDGKWLEYGSDGKLIRESSWKDGECISGDWCPEDGFYFDLTGDEGREMLQELYEAQSELNLVYEKLEEEQQKLNQLEAERAAAQEAFEKEQYNRLLTQEVQALVDLERTLIIEDQLDTLKFAYVNNIAARVKSYWRYQGAEDDWECTVYVRQDIDGRVEAVNIQKCNIGDSQKARSFQNSIERAVYKASPLPPAPDDAVFAREILFTFIAG